LDGKSTKPRDSISPCRNGGAAAANNAASWPKSMYHVADGQQREKRLESALQVAQGAHLDHLDGNALSNSAIVVLICVTSNNNRAAAYA
jgi:hypothetical protein